MAVLPIISCPLPPIAWLCLTCSKVCIPFPARRCLLLLPIPAWRGLPLHRGCVNAGHRPAPQSLHSSSDIEAIQQQLAAMRSTVRRVLVSGWMGRWTRVRGVWERGGRTHMDVLGGSWSCCFYKSLLFFWLLLQGVRVVVRW